MSTAVAERVVSQKKIPVSRVVEVLEEIAAAEPDRVDPRAEDGLLPRYLDKGQPNCLVAKALSRLGFSRGVLRALDREHPTGELVDAGVQVAESRHPALRKLDPTARALLQYVQQQQDRGLAWGRVTREALTPSRWFTRRDRERKPWLSC